MEERQQKLMVPRDLDSVLEILPSVEDAAAEIKETLLANLIMIGEVPAPTFEEDERVRFLRNRFTECGLQNCSCDEKGNGFGVLPGQRGDRCILLVAHVDTVFSTDVDHSIVIRPESVQGPGLGDNSLGVAVLVTLPGLLEKLGIQLQSDLLLMGATRSLGRGDLEGLRFFLSHNQRPIAAGVCVEGVRLGRLSYKSIGMIRSELTCTVPDEYDWTRFGASSAILTLNLMINKIMEIPRPNRPRTSIIMGSIQGGSSYSTMATSAALRFEVWSESAKQAKAVWRQIQDIRAEVESDTGATICLNDFAHREPGGISFSHPLVRCTRSVMDALSIQPRMAPSTSELSALIDRKIPAVTLGMSHGRRLNKLDEEVTVSSIFTGLAQLIGLVLAVDSGSCDER